MSFFHKHLVVSIPLHRFVMFHCDEFSDVFCASENWIESSWAFHAWLKLNDWNNLHKFHCECLCDLSEIRNLSCRFSNCTKCFVLCIIPPCRLNQKHLVRMCTVCTYVRTYVYTAVYHVWNCVCNFPVNLAFVRTNAECKKRAADHFKTV